MENENHGKTGIETIKTEGGVNAVIKVDARESGITDGEEVIHARDLRRLGIGTRTAKMTEDILATGRGHRNVTGSDEELMYEIRETEGILLFNPFHYPCTYTGLNAVQSLRWNFLVSFRGVVADDFNVVSLWIEDEGCVIVGMILCS